MEPWCRPFISVREVDTSRDHVVGDRRERHRLTRHPVILVRADVVEVPPLTVEAVLDRLSVGGVDVDPRRRPAGAL
jgi:hypothetical protein